MAQVELMVTPSKPGASGTEGVFASIGQSAECLPALAPRCGSDPPLVLLLAVVACRCLQARPAHRRAAASALQACQSESVSTSISLFADLHLDVCCGVSGLLPNQLLSPAAGGASCTPACPRRGRVADTVRRVTVSLRQVRPCSARPWLERPRQRTQGRPPPRPLRRRSACQRKEQEQAQARCRWPRRWCRSRSVLVLAPAQVQQWERELECLPCRAPRSLPPHRCCQTRLRRQLRLGRQGLRQAHPRSRCRSPPPRLNQPSRRRRRPRCLASPSSLAYLACLVRRLCPAFRACRLCPECPLCRPYPRCLLCPEQQAGQRSTFDRCSL